MMRKKSLRALVIIFAIVIVGGFNQRVGFCDPAGTSPFGSNNAFRGTKGKTSDYLIDLGVGWVSDHIARQKIEKKEKGVIVYDFSSLEGKMREYGKQTRSNAWFVIQVPSKFNFEDGKSISNTKYFLPAGPISFDAYEQYLGSLLTYVNTTVEGWQVKYWSIENEPHSLYLKAFSSDREGAREAAEAYAELVERSQRIIRQKSPDAKVVFGGPGTKTTDKIYNRFYKKALEILKGKDPEGYFDFFDYHNFNSFQKYKENSQGKGIGYFRQLLADTGFEGKPIMIKAGATHSGMDALSGSIAMAYQTEKEQAEHLLKRFIYHVAEGVQLILWGTIMENESFDDDPHNFFNFTGLVYNGIPEPGQCDPEIQLPSPDPGDGIKKLSYYTFKLLNEKTAGSDWDNVQTVRNGDDNVYIYKLTKTDTGNPIWVVWWDYFDEVGYSPGDTKTITLEVGEADWIMVTATIPDAESGAYLNDYDYSYFFKTTISPVVGGQGSVMLTEIPIFIEISDEEGYFPLPNFPSH
jgi:hypothetical protein